MHLHATGVEKAAAPYGSWESPISAAADDVFADEKEVHGLAVAGDGRVLWVETRPEEGGREVLVKEGDGGNLDVTPHEFAVGSLAQMYRYGGVFAVQGDVVVFSNYTDQRLYRQTIGDNSPLPLTPDYGGSVVRFADGVFDPHFSRYITIMEDHCESSNPIATVVAVSTNVAEVNEPILLVGGNDFYAFPRIDPTEKRMAWIEWSNPNMSWDKAQLRVGYFSGEEEVQKRICIAGEYPEFVESPTEPKWSSKGVSLCGIANLASLRAGARKCDAYYIDNLVGNEQAYFQRSPINFVERFTSPVILFQGLEDTVVPPDQATTIYKAIKDKGLPVALVQYEGEQHGFRKAENIKFNLEQAMMFFARLFGHFKVADVITPIKIDNFD